MRIVSSLQLVVDENGVGICKMPFEKECRRRRRRRRDIESSSTSEGSTLLPTDDAFDLIILIVVRRAAIAIATEFVSLFTPSARQRRKVGVAIATTVERTLLSPYTDGFSIATLLFLLSLSIWRKVHVNNRHIEQHHRLLVGDHFSMFCLRVSFLWLKKWQKKRIGDSNDFARWLLWKTGNQTKESVA